MEKNIQNSLNKEMDFKGINKQKENDINQNQQKALIRLEENQIYSNIKRGNKIFPFVMEFNIMIYHIHNLLSFQYPL